MLVVIVKILFGVPGDWCSRHPRVMLGVVCLLVLLAQWLVDLATPPMVATLRPARTNEQRAAAGAETPR